MSSEWPRGGRGYSTIMTIGGMEGILARAMQFFFFVSIFSFLVLS